MSYDTRKFGPVSAGRSATVQTLYAYLDTVTNTIAEITTSGFFNDLASILDINDILFLKGTDDEMIAKVTAISPNVEVTEYVTAAIADGSVTEAKIASGAVSKVKLATGIKPSHISVYAGSYTTSGGSAQEVISLAGVTAADLGFVQLKEAGTTPRTVDAVEAETDGLRITFSGDPSTDHTVYYQILRATV